MTALEITLYVLLAMIGLGLSALFSGMEIGAYTINRVRLRVRAAHGEKRAMRLQAELNAPRRLLSTLLIGNNIANYLGTFGVAAVLAGFGLSEAAVIIANVLIMTPVLFVFGETLPKDLFRAHTDDWSYALSGVLRLARWILTAVGLVPVVDGFGRLIGRLVGAAPSGMDTARHRVSQLIMEGVGAGVITAEQVTLVDRALALRHRQVEAEMVPWRRVETIMLATRGDERLGGLRGCRFTRLPVLDQEGAVVGIVSTLDAAIEPGRPVAELMQPAITLPATMPVAAALRVMREKRQALAIVVDVNDRPVGMVTIKDLVEPLTGELAAW